MLQKRVFFEFATKYVAAHKDQKWTPALLGPNFTLEEADWEQIRQIMENRQATVSDSVWQADRPFMLQQVRAEIASATIGRVERYKILVEDDPQIRAAIDLFPQASSLMSRAMDGGKLRRSSPDAPETDATASPRGLPPQTATPEKERAPRDKP